MTVEDDDEKELHYSPPYTISNFDHPGETELSNQEMLSGYKCSVLSALMEKMPRG